MVQKKKRLPPRTANDAAVEPKRRGRPRAYEPDVALGKALELFRKGGFAATSLGNAPRTAVAASITMTAGFQCRVATVDRAVLNRITMPCPG